MSDISNSLRSAHWFISYPALTSIVITGASEPVEVDGVRSVDVQMCTDVGKVDVIDSATGKSVVPVDRPQYLQWNVNVVKTEAGWKFSDATNENALRCPA